MKSKKFVLAGLALLAITMVLLPLSGCKTEVEPVHTHTFGDWEAEDTETAVILSSPNSRQRKSGNGNMRTCCGK